MKNVPAVSLQNITYNFPNGLCLFRDFSLQIESSERVAIVGPSGAGKSTLLEITAGLAVIQAGARRLEASNGAAPRTAYIFQKDALLPWHKLEKNILLQATCGDLPVDVVRARGEEWVKKLGLAQLWDKYPGTMSGGERQRASIAMWLATDPDILLLDEPSSSLDFQSKLILEEKLVEMLYGETPRPTILVTHDIYQALVLADRVLVLGRKAAEPATVVYELNVDLCPHERQPAAARNSSFIRGAFEEIWRRLRPFVVQS